MKVLTSHEWLSELLDGTTNSKGTAKIEIMRDADGLPIIGTSILNDPDWNMDILTTSPDGEIKPLREWFWEIDFNPIISDF